MRQARHHPADAAASLAFIKKDFAIRAGIIAEFKLQPVFHRLDLLTILSCSVS